MMDSMTALYIALPFVMGALLLQAALLVVNVKLELERMGKMRKVGSYRMKTSQGFYVEIPVVVARHRMGSVTRQHQRPSIDWREGMKVLMGVLAIGLIVGVIVIASIMWWWLHYGGWGT